MLCSKPTRHKPISVPNRVNKWDRNVISSLCRKAFLNSDQNKEKKIQKKFCSSVGISVVCQYMHIYLFLIHTFDKFCSRMLTVSCIFLFVFGNNEYVF